MFRKVRLYAGTAAIVLSAAPAFAQTTATPAPASQSDNDGIQDIVVTANKRAENINKVGMSITAISGEALKEKQITSLQDIASIVPGLQFAASTSNTPIFTLRGVGFNENSLGVYPAVSVYLDQAPLPFPVMASHAAYDLERVEALKGPQGTLFGQNSTGGAINYIAAKPTDTFQTGADLTYGQFNQLSGNGYISGPITDTLSARVAVTGLRQDAWQRSLTRGDRNGAQSYYGGRLLLEWRPTDRLRFSANANGWIDKSEPLAQQLIAKGPALPAQAQPVYLAAPFTQYNARSADWTTTVLDPTDGQIKNFRPYSNRKFYQLSLRTDYDVTDDVTVTALTTYAHFTQSQSTDGDGMAANDFDLPRTDGRLSSFNQEVRIANAATNAFRWVIGGSFEHSKTYELQDDRYIDNSNNSAPNFFINQSLDVARQNIHNYAAFANGEYSLTSQLSVLAGVRYTNSKIEDYNCGYTLPGGNVEKIFNYLGGVLGTVPFTPIGTGPGQCYTLNYNNVPGEAYQSTLHQDNVSWRAGLNFQATPTTLIYGNVSRGYKAGSFPTLAASTFVSLQPVTQESVTAYEVGFKTQMFDRKVALNGAAFYYDYRDKQIRGKLLDPVFGILDALVNVPKSRIWGLEGSATVKPMQGLTLSGDITYLNSKTLRYAGVNLIGVQDNFAGDALPFTPKLSGNFNADYRFETANGTPFVGFTVTGRTSEDATLGGSRILWPVDRLNYSVAPGVKYVYRVNGYASVDARFGYESKAGWKAVFWGRNIFNKYYFNTVIAGSSTAARIAAMPATYGVTLSVNFK